MGVEYTGLELLAGFGVIFVAYLVRGITGFGSGLIAIPLLTLMFPLTIAVPVVVLLDLIGSGAQAINNRKHTDWQLLLPLIPVTIIGIALAAVFFKHIDTSLLTTYLGVFVMCFAVYQLLPVPDIHGGPMMALPFGLLGGLIGTLFGTGGPFYVLYFSVRGIDKEEFRASYSVYFVLDGILRLGVYVFGLSLISTEWLPLLALALIPFALGLYAGGKVHREIDPMLFKKLISLILVASGAALILKS